MKYFKKLVGDRIYLSPRSTEDYEIFTEWLNDFETTDYLGRSGQTQSVSAEKDFLNEHANQRAAFVIVTFLAANFLPPLISNVAQESANTLSRSTSYFPGVVLLASVTVFVSIGVTLPSLSFTIE